MEYDKFCVSLYDSSPLPKMYVSIEKRADQLRVRLFQSQFTKGVLFIHSAGKNALIRITGPHDEFLLKSGFEFDKTYFVQFVSGEKSYVGSRGEVKDREKIVATFRAKYDEIRKRDKELLSPDKNLATDEIIVKMFGHQSTFFFDQTKRQLTSLFMSSKRAGVLENIIPYSKFCIASEAEQAYLGVVYQKGKAYAVGIGYCDRGMDKLKNQASYQYFYDKKGEGPGYFLTFRRASDGDVVEI